MLEQMNYRQLFIGVISVLIIGAAMVMIGVGRELPSEMWVLVGAVSAHWFSQGTTDQVEDRQQRTLAQFVEGVPVSK